MSTVLIEKIKFYLREIRWNLSGKSILTRVFYIMHRRTFLPGFIRRILYLVAVQQRVFLYEPHMKPYFSIKENEIFLDVGANVGLYTYYLAPKCKEVHAWEPNPRTASILEANTTKCGNVVVHCEGLGDKEGKFPFHVPKWAGRSGLIIGTANYTESFIHISIKRLDSYNFQGRIGLIKVDTEGYEVPVVKGALKTIQTHKPRLILEMHMPYEENARDIKKLLPNYRWKRVYKEKSNGDNPFHLVGVSR